MGGPGSGIGSGSRSLLNGRHTDRWDLSDVEPLDIDSRPWERWDGEKDHWYNRFHDYLMLGKNRSIRQTYVLYRGDKNPKAIAPQYWYDASIQWRWSERAAAFDAYQNQRDLERYEQERDESRTLRRAALTELGNLARDKFSDLEGQTLTWGNAAKVVEVVTEGLRSEFNDLPSQRIENTVQVKFVREVVETCINVFIEINELPDPDVRREKFAEKLIELSATLAPQTGEIVTPVSANA